MCKRASDSSSAQVPPCATVRRRFVAALFHRTTRGARDIASGGLDVDDAPGGVAWCGGFSTGPAGGVPPDEIAQRVDGAAPVVHPRAWRSPATAPAATATRASRRASRRVSRRGSRASRPPRRSPRRRSPRSPPLSASGARPSPRRRTSANGSSARARTRSAGRPRRRPPAPRRRPSRRRSSRCARSSSRRRPRSARRRSSYGA